MKKEPEKEYLDNLLQKGSLRTGLCKFQMLSKHLWANKARRYSLEEEKQYDKGRLSRANERSHWVGETLTDNVLQEC